MNHLDAALAARSFRAGRALRSAALRHRRLVDRPLAAVLWQLAGEPFSAAALGWGDNQGALQMSVAGEPRNRDLAFAALLPFANWFNEHFEAHAADCEEFTRGEYTVRRARTAPQVLVANAATVAALGNLGRRLAYLPTSGPRPADEALVRLGRHLRFLWAHAALPGQQLVVALTDLLNAHWATAQSPLERQSLAALDAWVEPPAGELAFDASARAELLSVGPVPDGDEDGRLYPLVEQFNERRAGGTDPAVVGPLLGPVAAHYRPLVDRTWRLLWRCRGREAAYPEAPAVARRWEEDRDAYTRHLEWLAQGGRQRARQTARQAALRLHALEEAQSLVEAEEACDDPLRMIPHLLQHKAVRGRVVATNPNHTEPGAGRKVRRPLVTLHSPDPSPLPQGKELWWTEQAAGREYVVEAVQAAPDGGALVMLKLMTGHGSAVLPRVGAEACFSVHHTGNGYRLQLPREEPWTHRVAAAAPSGIEDEGGA
jgi:hypothetical protein